MLTVLVEAVAGLAGEEGVKAVSLLGGLLTVLALGLTGAWKAARLAFAGTLSAYRWATKEVPIGDEAAMLITLIESLPSVGRVPGGLIVGGVEVDDETGRVRVMVHGTSLSPLEDATSRFTPAEIRAVGAAMRSRRALCDAADRQAIRQLVADAAQGNGHRPAKG